MQPPSGGCVLKRKEMAQLAAETAAATFGWLCVETTNNCLSVQFVGAATFGWLCVETCEANIVSTVESSSHLRVAVC